jgi:hypothetical protein
MGCNGFGSSDSSKSSEMLEVMIGVEYGEQVLAFLTVWHVLRCIDDADIVLAIGLGYEGLPTSHASRDVFRLWISTNGSLRYINDTVIILAFGWTERIAYEPSVRRSLSIMTLVERCRGFVAACIYLL